jgi:hypothetical protein
MRERVPHKRWKIKEKFKWKSHVVEIIKRERAYESQINEKLTRVFRKLSAKK